MKIPSFYIGILCAKAMISKTILGASLAVVFLTIMMAPVFAAASWQHVNSSSVSPLSSKVTKATVVAADSIPQQTSVLGGFAWFYGGGPNTVFVAVTHKGVVDSTQNPNGWHTHNVQLAIGASSGSDACITGLGPDTFAGTAITGNTINVNVANSALTGTLTGGAVAFTIVGDAGCAGTGLGVNLS
jgi:hypothetical protein